MGEQHAKRFWSCRACAAKWLWDKEASTAREGEGTALPRQDEGGSGELVVQVTLGMTTVECLLCKAREVLQVDRKGLAIQMLDQTFHWKQLIFGSGRNTQQFWCCPLCFEQRVHVGPASSDGPPRTVEPLAAVPPQSSAPASSTDEPAAPRTSAVVMPYEVIKETSDKLGIPIGDLKKRGTWLGPAGERSMATVDEPQKELLLNPACTRRMKRTKRANQHAINFRIFVPPEAVQYDVDAKDVIKWIPGQFDPRPFCQGYLQPRDEGTRQRLAQARNAQPMVPSPSHFKAPPPLQSPPPKAEPRTRSRSRTPRARQVAHSNVRPPMAARTKAPWKPKAAETSINTKAQTEVPQSERVPFDGSSRAFDDESSDGLSSAPWRRRLLFSPPWVTNRPPPLPLEMRTLSPTCINAIGLLLREVYGPSPSQPKPKPSAAPGGIQHVSASDSE